MSPQLHLASPAELDASTLYRILRLRVDVFVVEQQCPYPELDGRDLEPGTRWLWATGDTTGTNGTAGSDTVLATLRILREDRRTARIGRVATAVQARTGGIATALMRRALDVLDTDSTDSTVDTDNSTHSTGLEVLLDAQTPLAGWYRRFGFEVAGPEFVEDGISHLPMRRLPASGGRQPDRSGT